MNKSAFNNALEKIKSNKERRLKGEDIVIPLPFKRLSEYIPGIEQGTYYGVTAGTKSGKSQLADFIFIMEPIDWYIKNKDKTNIKLKIFVFSLEMSIDSKIRSIMSYKLFKDYGKIISPKKLLSRYEGYILDDEVEQILNSIEFKLWFEQFENIVEYHDNIRNPYGMFNVVHTYALKHGHYEKRIMELSRGDGTYEKKEVRGRYISDNPDEFVIVLTDHVGLQSPEKGGILFQAMSDHSSEYSLYLRDKLNYIPVDIHQQAFEGEKQQYTNVGTSIIEKLRPSAENLGDNKIIGRNYNMLLGLFYPAKYGIENYKEYNLNRIGKNYRELSIIFDRDGESAINVPLYFNGACNFFKELPKLPDEEIYQKIEYYNQISE
jgi:hypothetical protein